MDHEDYCSSSRFSCSAAETGLWSYHHSDEDPSPPDMDGPYREPPRRLRLTRRHANVPLSRQSSGYSSNVSGCSSSRSNRGLNWPSSCYPLPRMRDSLVSVDEGSVVNNYFYINTAPTPYLEEQVDTYSLDQSSQIVRSASEPTATGRGRRGTIPTCNISPRNERLLNDFAPLLVDGMDASVLLPYLMRYGLANREDTDYISNPHRTSRERNMYIIRTAPYKDSNAFERFVKCLEEVENELASRLRQGMRRASPVQLRLANEPALDQQGYAREESNESESVMLPQDECDNEPDFSPPTQLPKVSHGEPNESESITLPQGERDIEPDFLPPAQLPSESMIVAQQLPERDVGTRSRDLSPPTRLPKVPQEERSLDSQEVHADFSHGDSSHYTCKKLMERKLTWLQESTVFLACHEEIQLSSQTNSGEHRKVLHYGTLYQQGKAWFVVLLTDILLVLKLLEPHSHLRRAAEQRRFEDHMFSDNKYITGKPLLLHHFEVQDQNKQQYSFSLHNKQTSVDLCFEAPSSTSRDVWVEALEEAIENSCRLQSRLKLRTGSERSPSGCSLTCLSLTILGASALVSGQECSGYRRRLFCTVVLGQHQQCRTPCVEGTTDASWNFTFEFWKFATTDTMEIGVWQENAFCPNDLLGVVRIPILMVTDQHTNAVHPGHEMEALFPLKPLESGEMHLKIYTDVTF